jgi:hypothetical protein
MQISGIKSVWEYMGNDLFWRNKRTVKMFCKKFGDLYDVATSPDKPTSQNGNVIAHDPAIRYNSDGKRVDRNGILVPEHTLDPARRKENSDRNLARLKAGIPPEQLAEFEKMQAQIIAEQQAQAQQKATSTP